MLPELSFISAWPDSGTSIECDGARQRLGRARLQRQLEGPRQLDQVHRVDAVKLSESLRVRLAAVGGWSRSMCPSPTPSLSLSQSEAAGRQPGRLSYDQNSGDSPTRRRGRTSEFLKSHGNHF
eukprot:1232996-Rhodomonas_salina.2